MKNTIRLLGCAGLMAVFAGAVFGQAGGGIGAGVGSGVAAVPGLPYSAQQVTEHRQTLADGTHIEEKPRTTLLFRDSQGRTRTEHFVSLVPNGDATVPMLIQIQDPVAGVLYTLDAHNHIAHCITMRKPGETGVSGSVPRISLTPPPPPPPPPPPAVGNGGMSNANVMPQNRIGHSSESLGTQVMEGVTVEGRRITTTIPVGMQGNDRPLVSTTETWRSRELNTIVLSKTSDPRNGETVTRLTNIRLGEPDPALFQPPPDYTIVDDTNGSSIEFRGPPPGR